MTSENQRPAPTLKTGDTFQGFRVLRVEAIEDLRITAYEMKHERTGARVLHLHSRDRENLYAIGFRTPPPDSTGVPHILEHSVLAGSERYPLKDAFNELHKGTLQTFLNAFTYPDKTIYPVASQLRTDFYNLARVYTDLVLRPRLLKETFYQEGHHLELADPADPSSDLIISGIVYNEMKGAYSSPDNLMSKALQENLYPDNPYAFDSGGDPEVIPRLSYEQFKAFHRSFYSPGNARIFLYGDIPTADHLEFLAEMLQGFERIPVDSSIASQKRLAEPVHVRNFFPLAKGEKTERETTVNCAWMLAENTDMETALLLKITSAMLVGSSAGPLRKALIDSRLGEDLSPVTGLEQDYKQMYFAAGLRGTDPGKAQDIEKLIFTTLEDIYRKGFDRELIEGTIHQVEFHGKEIVRTTHPYGISLMGAAYYTWLYEGDPLVGLNFPRAIAQVRRKWNENPAIFQEMIKKWFLENRHRVLSVMEPSATFLEERENRFRQKMRDLKARLSPSELEKIQAEAASLRQFQTEPDPPEAVASLPRLKIGEISRQIDIIPTERAVSHNVPVFKHDIFTNGIAYLDMAFDISDLAGDLQVYLPMLGKLTVQMGAAGLDYEAMAKRIALKAGGISFQLAAGLAVDGSQTWQKLIFRAKALYRHVGETVDILKDILTAGDLSEKKRMIDLMAERKNGLNASVIPGGHVFARRAAAATLSLPAYRDEQWNGRTQLRFMNQIAGRNQTGDLQDRFAHLRDLIFRKGRLTLNMTADSEGISLLSEAAAALIESLPEDRKPVCPAATALPSPTHLGIIVPAQVSYVAKVIKAPAYASSPAPSLLVASRFLSDGYLYKHIRVQGGAYGGMCHYDPLGGLFAFLSYRDPHIVETLKVYGEVPDFLVPENIKEEDLEKAVIGAIASLDKPMDPATRGFTAMIREFSCLDDSLRMRVRNGILEMTREKFLEGAQSGLLSGLQAGVVAVMGAEDRLKSANEILEEKLQLEPLT